MHCRNHTACGKCQAAPSSCTNLAESQQLSELQFPPAHEGARTGTRGGWQLCAPSGPPEGGDVPGRALCVRRVVGREHQAGTLSTQHSAPLSPTPKASPLSGLRGPAPTCSQPHVTCKEWMHPSWPRAQAPQPPPCMRAWEPGVDREPGVRRIYAQGLCKPVLGRHLTPSLCVRRGLSGGTDPTTSQLLPQLRVLGGPLPLWAKSWT